MTTRLHVAIIPDGNRRWAKAQGLQPWKGHEKSAETFETLINWCRDDGRVQVLTIWVFSTENWKRDEQEVQKLMGMFEKYLKKEKELFHKNKTRLLHSGRKDRLSDDLRRILEEIIEETKDYKDFTLNIALDYGGKDEVLRAVETLRDDLLCHGEEGVRSATVSNHASKSPQGDMIQQHLDNPDLQDIDLIIRTSGEQRTSNFFLWQSTYAEWIFTKTLFPDFGTEEMQQCLDAYQERNRRFGG